MSLEFYKLLHLTGVFMLIFSLGGVIVHAINGGTKQSNKFRKGIMATHGIGLLLILFGGFGLLARLGLVSEFPMWSVAKILIWLTLGGVIGVIYRKPASARSLWFFLIMLAVLAAFLGIYKPV